MAPTHLAIQAHSNIVAPHTASSNAIIVIRFLRE